MWGRPPRRHVWGRPPRPSRRAQRGVPAHHSPVDRKSILICMRTTQQLRIALCTLALAMLSLPALPAQTSTPPDPHSVPVIDGGIGSCSADFTVTDATNAPVYAAKI